MSQNSLLRACYAKFINEKTHYSTKWIVILCNFPTKVMYRHYQKHNLWQTYIVKLSPCPQPQISPILHIFTGKPRAETTPSAWGEAIKRGPRKPPCTSTSTSKCRHHRDGSASCHLHCGSHCSCSLATRLGHRHGINTHKHYRRNHVRAVCCTHPFVPQTTCVNLRMLYIVYWELIIHYGLHSSAIIMLFLSFDY